VAPLGVFGPADDFDGCCALGTTGPRRILFKNAAIFIPPTWFDSSTVSRRLVSLRQLEGLKASAPDDPRKRGSAQMSDASLARSGTRAYTLGLL
jgi:hypothetical protein